MNKKEGIDVVIGLIETHGREETAALIGILNSTNERNGI